MTISSVSGLRDREYSARSAGEYADGQHGNLRPALLKEEAQSLEPGRHEQRSEKYSALSVRAMLDCLLD